MCRIQGWRSGDSSLKVAKILLVTVSLLRVRGVASQNLFKRVSKMLEY
jgi:hypothetical protein